MILHDDERQTVDQPPVFVAALCEYLESSPVEIFG